VKAYRIKQKIWDKERDCILTYSQELYSGQLTELNENIKKAYESLTMLNTQLANKKSRISKLPKDIKIRVDNILSTTYLKAIIETELVGSEKIIENVDFRENEEKKSDITYKYFGKKLIITDRFELETAVIIEIFRNQDCIEKIFRDLKNTDHFSVRPQYHYTDQKIRVHVFCTLLGLTLATILHKEVIESGYKISKTQLLEALRL
jgi:transposase